MKELKNYRYEVSGNSAKLWHIDDAADKEPFLYQPHNPLTGVAFVSDEEAEQWIIEYIHNN